jgi:hypothetical protein
MYLYSKYNDKQGGFNIAKFTRRLYCKFSSHFFFVVLKNSNCLYFVTFSRKLSIPKQSRIMGWADVLDILYAFLMWNVSQVTKNCFQIPVPPVDSSSLSYQSFCPPIAYCGRRQPLNNGILAHVCLWTCMNDWWIFYRLFLLIMQCYVVGIQKCEKRMLKYGAHISIPISYITRFNIYFMQIEVFSCKINWRHHTREG